jgi:hypothetical protein
MRTVCHKISVFKLFPAEKCVNLTESIVLSDKSSILKLFRWKIFVGKCPSNLLLDISKAVKEDSSEKYSRSLPVIQLFARLITISERSLKNEWAKSR